MATQSKQVQLSPLGNALAGALGGCFSNAVVYPLDVAKTRIQADEKGKKKASQNMLSVILEILNEDGIAGLYSGFAATMLNTFSTQYAYFFFYSLVRTTYIKRLTRKLSPASKPPVLSTAAELLLGALAGALAQVFTIPVSVIATRQQVGNSSKEKKGDRSFSGVAREIIREEGVTGLWLGMGASLVLTVNPAITYGVFERIKSLLILARAKVGTGPTSDKLLPGQAFTVGALSKTLATVVTYPYIMAKVRIQARSSDESEEELPQTASSTPPQSKSTSKNESAVTILKRVYGRDGLTGWYQGMSAQIIKAVLSQALLFMSKDQFEAYALQIIMFITRLRASS